MEDKSIDYMVQLTFWHLQKLFLVNILSAYEAII